MKGLLLAGGHGTRLRPLTFTGNKHMLPIANKQMILYGLEHLVNGGIKEVAVILGPIKEDVKEFLKDGSGFGAKITYIDQPDPKGLAHAILISEDFLGSQPFTMYLGDNMLKQGAQPLIDLFKKKESDCVIGLAAVKDPSRYGVAILDEEGRIKSLVEKPKQPVSNSALIGVYVFNNKIFEAIKKIKPSWRGELEITDAIQVLMDSGAKVDYQIVEGWWKDTGRPEDLLEANQLVLQELRPLVEGMLEEGATVVGNVRIGRETVIRSRTTIRGPVIIGRHCEIGPNTYIGPYTSVGDDVTIRNSEVENSIVMNGAYIESGKRVIDSLIGMKAKIVSAESNLPKGLKLILGDMTYVST
jgi:glucose-1-phosphate thymidylyltransferase